MIQNVARVLPSNPLRRGNCSNEGSTNYPALGKAPVKPYEQVAAYCRDRLLHGACVLLSLCAMASLRWDELSSNWLRMALGWAVRPRRWFLLKTRFSHHGNPLYGSDCYFRRCFLAHRYIQSGPTEKIIGSS